MKPLHTEAQYATAKWADKLPLQCYQCGHTFYQTKHQISKVKRKKAGVGCKYCCKSCQYNGQHKIIITQCEQCNEPIIRTPSATRKQKKRCKHLFCSLSCAATYHNTHKTTGIRRSKLEAWLQMQLTHKFPNLAIEYNRKDIIGSELDIFIPRISVAFELNGIFHYEPIFGPDKLNKIQNNDNRKFQACLEHNIEICILDVSQMSYFKPNKAQKFLDIITDIITQKLRRRRKIELL